MPRSREGQRAWYWANREEILAKRRVEYKAKPPTETRRQAARRWKKANPERHRELNKRYADKNRARIREQSTRYRGENADALRANRRQMLYGITAEQFEAMFTSQNSTCASCGSTEHRGRNWHVDHDHETGFVRGILCSPCNAGIGSLGDSTAGLLNALEYLMRAQNRYYDEQLSRGQSA